MAGCWVEKSFVGAVALARSASWVALVALVAAIIGFFQGQPAAGQGPTSLSGRVVNGTPGASVPADLVVTLRAYRESLGLGQWTTTPDKGGQFLFPQVPLGPGISFVVSTEYLGVPYTMRFDGGLPRSPVDLVIYETAPLGSASLVLDSAVVVSEVVPQQGRMTIVEIHRLENGSHHTLVPAGDGGAVLNIPVLGEAGDLRVQTDLPVRAALAPEENPPSVPGARELEADLLRRRLVELSGGTIGAAPLGRLTLARGERFSLSSPIPPGRYDVIVTYTVPYSHGPLRFVYSPGFSTRTFDVLVPEGMGTAQGPGLRPRPGLAFQGVNFQVWEATNLSPGGQVTVTIRNEGRGSLWERLTGSAAAMGLVSAAGLLLAGTVVYALVWRRRRGPAA